MHGCMQILIQSASLSENLKAAICTNAGKHRYARMHVDISTRAITVPSRSVAVAYRLRHNSMRWKEQCGKKQRGNTRRKKKIDEMTLLHI